MSVLHREHDFDAPEEIARHPVGAGEKDFGIAGVGEIEEPAVLQEPVDDTDDPDLLGYAGQTGAQTADPANHEVDDDSRLRCAIQRVDHRYFDERIHLHDDPRRLTRFRMAAFALDQLDHPLTQLDRRHEQLAPAAPL